MRERRGDLPLCAAAAVVLLTLCSMCSPLYPLNIWDDANCLLTVGRAMKHGAVLYRDIYEQKGPLLYLLHMLAACVTETSFAGVFLFEVVSFTATLAFACRLIALRTDAWMARAGAVLFGACVLVSRSFARGDSAEEFCLPFLMAGLYMLCVHHEHSDEPLPPAKMLMCGVLAGCVAAIKFTALGLFLGICLTQALCCARRGGVGRLCVSAAAFLTGMVLPLLPWLLYFAAHGALGEAYTAYIHNNVFLYNAGERSGIWSGVLEAGGRNALWALPAVLGVMHVLWRGRPVQRAGVLATALCACAAVFLPGTVYPYYPLVLCVFAPLGLRAACAWLGRYVRHSGAAAAVACALSVGIAALCSPNAFLRGVPLRQTAQGRLAAQMEPGATLLQYSHLDDGLYLTSGALPQERFFVLLNVDYAPMREALDSAVREGRPDYVLVSWRELPEAFDGYGLVAHEIGYDDENRPTKDLYLYRRKAE